MMFTSRRKKRKTQSRERFNFTKTFFYTLVIIVIPAWIFGKIQTTGQTFTHRNWRRAFREKQVYDTYDQFKILCKALHKVTSCQADVRYELPIAFSLKPANQTEIKECKQLVCNMLESELGEHCKSFVADKGLDADELRKIFYRHGVTTAIDVRRMWQLWERSSHNNMVPIMCRA